MISIRHNLILQAMLSDFYDKCDTQVWGIFHDYCEENQIEVTRHEQELPYLCSISFWLEHGPRLVYETPINQIIFEGKVPSYYDFYFWWYFFPGDRAFYPDRLPTVWSPYSQARCYYTGTGALHAARQLAVNWARTEGKERYGPGT